jgi:hypothetical protein
VNIELTSMDELKAAQTAVAATTLVTCGLTQRLINAPDDGTGTIGSLLGILQNVEGQILAYIEKGQTTRKAQLLGNIVVASEEGRIAEQELAVANAGVMNARIGDANRENAYNAAVMKLNTAKEMPLGRFYTDADTKAKDEAILLAQAEVDAALLDMQLHPLAIPQAIQRKQDAERKVQALASRVAAYRSELESLGGAKAQATGTTASATGLAG